MPSGQTVGLDIQSLVSQPSCSPAPQAAGRPEVVDVTAEVNLVGARVSEAARRFGRAAELAY
eukprot:9529459-Alexandrium_andersonii.AAC.1